MNEAVQAVTAPVPGVDGDRGTYKLARLVLLVIFALTTLGAVLLLPGAGAGAWAMFTAAWIFVLGLSQFGICFTAIMRLSGGRWARPLYRLAETITLAFAPFAFIGLFIVYFGGRDELFYWLDAGPDAHLSPWLNESFLFWRNLVAQLVFYGVAYFYVRDAMAPDVDADGGGGGVGGALRSLFRSAGARGDDAREDRLYRWSPIVLLAAGLSQTFIAWDFAMMLWPHYHSTVFTMYFMIGSMFGGTAAILLLAALMRRFVRMDEVFATRQYKNIGIMLTGFMCLWLYFFWAQFFVSWFGNLPQELRPLDAQMKGWYSPFFWFMVACLFALPLAFLIFAGIKRRLLTLGAVAALIVLGVWSNRYLMVLTPVDDHHAPLLDFAGMSGALALGSGFLLVLLLLFDIFPMLSRWEIERIPADERAEWHSHH